jgi:hypothetical protein
MAKSRLIVGRKKKSTVLVSVRTLQEAINRANMSVEQLMESDPNDPQIAQIENAVQHMSRILKANPQQMKQDGVSSISDYMDDAVKPEEARKLKNEVDMILKMVKGQRQPGVGNVPDSAVYQHGADQYPSGATESGQYEFDPAMKHNLRPIAESVHASSKKNADGGAAFTTDRNEKGEAKAPEKLEVPRVAKKKKEAVPEEPMAAAPVAPAVPEPVPAAPGGSNPIDFIPTETLIKVIGDLPKEDDFAQNKGKQDAVVQLTEILKSRPVLPPEQPEGAAPVAPAAAAPAPAIPAPVAASAKKADLGDHAVSDSGSSSHSPSINPSSSRPSANPAPIAPKSQTPSTPEKATVGFGGLEVASALEEEKTADDYRVQDYKLTGEGVRPTGKKPNLQEQEEHGVPQSTEFPNPAWTEEPEPMMASVNKEAVTPPGISEELMHKLKKQYPGDKSKAYATAWSIHNKKESSLQIDAAFEAGVKFASAEIAKFAAAGNSGGWYTSYKPMEVDEDGGRTPEIAEAHSKLEDNTGISHPETTMPIKLSEQQSLKASAKTAADMTTGKAVKESETIGNDLKKMYLDAKSLTQVNDTRAVREAVESIFRAADMFDEATKALNKQHQQEESEAAAAEIKDKNKGKKSSFEGLALAAAAE